MRASRNSVYASIELPDGVGWSSKPFMRATSSSPSDGVRKNPPRASSPKSSIASSASRRDSASQRGSPVATCEELLLQIVRELAPHDEAPVLERLQKLPRYAVVRRPGEREALDAVGVRVLCGSEAALRQRELAEHVRHRLVDDLAVALVARHEPAVEVRRDEERVVVEHLLEVRHEPPLVDRVA